MEETFEALKKKAALAAVDHVESEMIVGLGTGSTAKYAIQEIGNRLQTRQLRHIKAVSTSTLTDRIALNYGIDLIDIPADGVDLTIDGADEVDNNLNLIKGLGGALLREKIVANSSKKLIIITDYRKKVDFLGQTAPVPLEVTRFGLSSVLKKVSDLGVKVSLRTRNGLAFVTDNGNFVADARFHEISDPFKLQIELKSIPGVIETGIFFNMADMAYIATATGLEVMENKK